MSNSELNKLYADRDHIKGQIQFQQNNYNRYADLYTHPNQPYTHDELRSFQKYASAQVESLHKELMGIDTRISNLEKLQAREQTVEEKEQKARDKQAKEEDRSARQEDLNEKKQEAADLKQKEKAERAAIAREETAKAEASKQSAPTVFREEIRKEYHQGKVKAAEAMAFLARKKEERAKAKEGATPDAAFMTPEEERKKRRKKQRDNEWEPE